MTRPDKVLGCAHRQPGTVVIATFRGASTRLRVLRTDGVEVVADVPSHRTGELGPGRRVAMSLLERPVLLADD